MDEQEQGIHHTVLCVDDEVNILQALKRLLRKEDYTLLTASSGREGLELLENNDVHLVLSDQRMPEMSGTEFLAEIKVRYPDVIRIILTGYTEVDAITDSINRGHIYKFFLKPWNDDNLKLEIRKALDQYDLIKANERLTKTVLNQNEILKNMNEELEGMVRQRTKELELRNQALELSQAIFENIPYPIMGVSDDNSIVLFNKMASEVRFKDSGYIVIGESIDDYFNADIVEVVRGVFEGDKGKKVMHYPMSDGHYTIDISPLSGQYQGKGILFILIRET